MTAQLLNTNLSSIRHWENNWNEPEIKSLPKIIKFIGSCPYDANLTFFQRVIIWRIYNGLSQRRMAEIACVDSSTLSRFEAGKKISIPKQKKILGAATKLREIN